ncbi:YibE/F, partial [Virgibacillus profundi]
ALAAIVGVAVLYPWGQDSPTSVVDSGTPVDGDVTAAASGPCLPPGEVRVGDQQPVPGEPVCLTVTILLSDGPAAGSTVTKDVPIEPSTPRFAVGDAVVLAYSGADAASPEAYQLVDFQRGLPLAVLAGL